MSIYDADRIEVEKVDYDQAFNHVFEIRKAVFVDEFDIDQEDDYDGFDHLAHHYLVYLNHESVATGRWRRTQTGGRYRIERIAVLPTHRRQHIGSLLVESILNDIPRDKEIFVHTPVNQIPFFLTLGFQESGFEFEEAGINHKKLIYLGQ